MIMPLALFVFLATLGGMTSCSINSLPSSQDNHQPDYDKARESMVRNQLMAPGRGITNQAVIAAMRKVPRHEFVPLEYQSQAYSDHPLSIGHQQTISQPFIVAFMTEKLSPRKSDRVLEIGTGSGYQAAVLAELVAEVYTIEIVAPLGHQAETTLRKLGYQNIKVKIGDGNLGWSEFAPFDSIIVTCAPDHVPPALISQLKEGGLMIVPVEENHDQYLYLLRKTGETLQKSAVLPVRFVPMTGTKIP